MFVVCAFKEKIGIVIPFLDKPADISLCWADGMIGALPIFETREDAEFYANGKCKVVEVDCLGSINSEDLKGDHG